MTAPSSEIRWFSDGASYRAFSGALAPNSGAVDEHIGRLSTFRGYCHKCRGIVDFEVQGGAAFGDHPNLREGLLCTGCGLNNRQRMMFNAVATELGCQEGRSILLLERFSRLYDQLHGLADSLIGTEFLGPDRSPGETVVVNGVEVRHESATRLSFPDDALDLVVHGDVLEHIADYRGALKESWRVLHGGGVLLFTCPFFESRAETLVRARVRPDGSIEHLEPLETHGDPLSAEGILSFYHFGWTLMDDLEDAGFADVQIGVHYDPMAGLTGNNYGYDRYGTMLPLLFRCEK